MKSNRFHFFEWQLKYENGAFKNDCFLIVHNFSLLSISRSFAKILTVQPLFRQLVRKI